jgi:competence protein ComEA
MQSELPEPSRDLTLPESSALGRGSSLSSQLRASIWLQPVLKGLALAAGAAVLATIGAIAARVDPASVHRAGAQEASLLSLQTSEWLAGAPLGAASVHDTAIVTAATPRGTDHVASAAVESLTANGAAPSGAITADGKVILNLASVAELRKLPGVGPRRAAQIVELREKLRGFRKLSDLLRVKGIGPKGLHRMLPLLVLNAPPPPNPQPGASSGTATPPVAPPAGSTDGAHSPRGT